MVWKATPEQKPVSTTTIRSRILKEAEYSFMESNDVGFNHHDPFEDTERL